MTEREALRLLHLDEGCSRDQLRRAYLDMVKVWHPDRFQTDSKLRAKAERTLQRINDAYALLQGRSSKSTAAPVPGAEEDDRPDRAREKSRAHAAAPVSRPTTTRLTRYLVIAAAAGTAAGVVLAVVTIVRWNGESEPTPASSAAPVEVATPPPAADVRLNNLPQRFATRANADTARPDSGSELLSARGRGTGQVSTRNATAWDAAVLLDGPSGARGFFLRRGEQVTLVDIALGTYGLRLMFGATWTGRAFAQEAAFYQREEPVEIIGQHESAGARAPLIVLERAGMRSVAAFALE